MYCHITKDKATGEEFLIPYCYGVINMSHIDKPDRVIIKEYCYCDRPKRDKYETKTKDEVIGQIRELEAKMRRKSDELKEMMDELEGLKTEVFMLNTEIVYP